MPSRLGLVLREWRTFDSGRPRPHQKGAVVAAVDAMGDPCLRQRRVQEIELARAGVAVLQRHPEDGAVALGDDEGAVGAAREVGQVVVPVEDLGDAAHLLGEW